MDLYELKKLIDINFNNRDYCKTITFLEQYLETENVGIFDWLLDIYIQCQIKLGYNESASKNIDLMNKLFPYNYDETKTAVRYVECGDMEKFNNHMLDRHLLDEDYYVIAKTCFYNDQHQIAKELFNKFISSSENNLLTKSAKEYVRKIEAYKNDPTAFIETKYTNFKLKGQNLLPGHVIYIKRLRKNYEINKYSTDPQPEFRPYMVWRVIDQKIYAFPLTSKIKEGNQYAIYHQNYHSYAFDRTIKDTLVCIHENDIQKVIDKITEQDYNILTQNLYRLGCLYPESSKSIRLFMDTLLKEIDVKIGHIILISDFENKIIRHFFVLDIDKENKQYKTLEIEKLKNGYLKLIKNDLINIDMSTYVLDSIQPNNEQTIMLKQQLPSEFKIEETIDNISEISQKQLIK